MLSTILRCNQSSMSANRLLNQLRLISISQSKLASTQIKSQSTPPFTSQAASTGAKPEFTTGWSWFNVRQFDDIQAQRNLDGPEISKRRTFHIFQLLPIWIAPFVAFLVVFGLIMYPMTS